MISILMMLFTFFSCQKPAGEKIDNKEEALRKTFILQNHEYKIWKYYDQNNKYSYTFIYFDEQGKCYNLMFNKTTDPHFEKFPYEDVIVPYKWSLRNDTLYFLGGSYTNIEVQKDTIKLYKFQEKKEIYLIETGLPPKS